MVPDGGGGVRLDYIMPARGLIGFRTEFLTATQAQLIYSVFDHYGPFKRGDYGSRKNGVMIATPGQGADQCHLQSAGAWPHVHRPWNRSL